MIIDIAGTILCCVALFYGFRTGLINALFTILAVFVSTLICLKFSSLTTSWLSEIGFNSPYLPIIGFAGTFLGAMIVLKFAGFSINKIIKEVGIGWANKIAGAVAVGGVVFMLMSIGLFYLDGMEFIPEDISERSLMYPLLIGYAPGIMDGIGYVLPFMSDIFDTFREFYDQIPVPTS